MAAKSEVTFVIRARDLTRGVFRRIRRQIRGVTRAMLNLRAALVGGVLAGLVNAWTSFGASVQAASDRLDMSTDSLQSWQEQARTVANVGAEVVNNVFQRINRNAGSAERGNVRMIENFERMGISFDELRRSSPDELILRLSAAAQKFNAAGRRREFASMLAEIGDSEAVKLLGLLERGPQAFLRGSQELIASGVIQTAEQIAAAAEVDAQIRREFMKASAEFSKIAVEMLPLINESLVTLNAAIQELKAVADDPLGTPQRHLQGPLERRGFNVLTDQNRGQFPGTLPSLVGGRNETRIITDTLKMIEKNTANGARLD